jgi:hypothetical protein
MLGPAQAAEKKQLIEVLGKEIDALATAAERGLAGYRQFDVVLGKLHQLGFFPETSLVFEVGHAFLRR